MMRIMPYRTAENVIDGVVVTFVNITPVREVKREAAAACRCFNEIVETSHDAMVVMDSQLRVMAGNEGFRRLCHAESGELAGKTIGALAENGLDLPPVWEALEKLAAKKVETAQGEATLKGGDGAAKTMTFRARRLDGFSDSMRIVLALTEKVE